MERNEGGVGAALLKIAAVYMVLGLAGGMAVAVTKRFAFTSVHSHVSLLGWVTMALTGLAYVVLPSLAASRLSRVHFWLHNVGLPVMIVSLTLLAGGRSSAEPLVGLGSILVLLGLVAFAANVLFNATPARRS